MINKLNNFIKAKDDWNVAWESIVEIKQKLNEAIDVLNQQGEGVCPAVSYFSMIAATKEQREAWDKLAVKHLKTSYPCHPKPNPPEREEIPKDEGGDTWSIWEGFDDRAGTLTRNFGNAGRPANIQDLQEVFISKEKIKRVLNDAADYVPGTRGRTIHNIWKSLGLDL